MKVSVLLLEHAEDVIGHGQNPFNLTNSRGIKIAGKQHL